MAVSEYIAGFDALVTSVVNKYAACEVIGLVIVAVDIVLIANTVFLRFKNGVVDGCVANSNPSLDISVDFL